MKYNIVIVGAGQLGARYLQGLASYPGLLFIYVIDVNEASLNNAKKIWDDTVKDTSLYDLHFGTEMSIVPKQIDLAIVSTGSTAREIIVSSLLQISVVKNWILEKVLAQNEASLDKMKALIGGNKHAWVNTFFRTLPWFREIRSLSATSGPIHVEVTGDNWGIACNTVHFLDFICWWTGEIVLALDNSELNNEWHPAKRNGFFEVNGILKTSFSGGSTAVFNADDSGAPFEIRIKTATEEWVIGWDSGIATRHDGFVVPGKILYQSGMTAGLVKNILTEGSCELPSLPVSIKQHKPFLSSLLDHWNTNRTAKDVSVPIT